MQDFIRKLYDNHPVDKLEGMLLAPRKYIDNVMTRGTSISADDFSSSTLDLLGQIVANEGPGQIDLKKDKSMVNKYGGDFVGGVDHVTTPYGQLRNTLGSFNVVQNDIGEYVLTDTYDWTHDYANMKNPDGLLNKLGKFAYEQGGTREGEGKPYQINLGTLMNQGMFKGL